MIMDNKIYNLLSANLKVTNLGLLLFEAIIKNKSDFLKIRGEILPTLKKSIMSSFR